MKLAAVALVIVLHLIVELARAQHGTATERSEPIRGRAN